MIGLDTNILVRYLTQDDPLQSTKATEILERRLTEETPGFVSIVAMVEIVWVLDRAYGLPAHKVAAAVERMLQTDVLVIETSKKYSPP
jgi:predicted nucleic-acid-binding protein